MEPDISCSDQQMKPVWQNGAVQSVAKYTAAAGAAGLSMFGFFKLLRHVAGVSLESSLEHLNEYVSAEDKIVLAYDPSLVDLVDRFETFAAMAPDAYKDCIRAAVDVARVRKEFDVALASRKVSMYEAKELRNVSQQWIETIRFFRNVLEVEKPNILEDFDDVAVDAQGYHVDLCEAALFDAQLSH